MLQTRHRDVTATISREQLRIWSKELHLYHDTLTESGIWVSPGPASDEVEPFTVRFPPTARTNVPLQVGNEAVGRRGYASFLPMLSEVTFFRNLCEGVVGMPHAEGLLVKALRGAPPTCMRAEV